MLSPAPRYTKYNSFSGTQITARKKGNTMEYSAEVTKHQGSSRDWCGLTEHVGEWGEKSKRQKRIYNMLFLIKKEEQRKNYLYEQKETGRKPKD